MDRFHAYVRPVINPVLSPYCTELTGIQQVAGRRVIRALSVCHADAGETAAQSTVDASDLFPEVWRALPHAWWVSMSS